MRGQVAELRGNIDEARRWYEEALSISPTHVKSMQRLVSPVYTVECMVNALNIEELIKDLILFHGVQNSVLFVLQLPEFPK